MKWNFCRCGRYFFGFGKLCKLCGSERRAARAALARKVKPHVRIPKKIRHFPEHYEWIKTLPCIVEGCQSTGSDPAHVRMSGTDGGTSLKPSDTWLVPMCRRHHLEQHAVGHYKFEQRHHVLFRETAKMLASISPYLKRDK